MSKFGKEARMTEFRAALTALGFANYRAYLASDHWSDLRRRYWQSRLPKCCYACGSKGHLDLHHRTYKRVGNERLTDLTLVCRECHQRIHEREKSAGAHVWVSTKKIRRERKKEAASAA
jgi:5-methylcytosine-specific restriction endonuclease McrA